MYLCVMNFQDLPIAPSLLHAIAQKGFTTLTAVQEQTIPVLMHSRDVLACAPTGTGKTYAYVLPMLHDLLSLPASRGVKALVLVPTRELAVQVSREIRTLIAKSGLQLATIIGGDSFDEQLYLLEKGVDILVATPGRLHHLQSRQLVDLRRVKWLILDEGDRMLDMGFVGVIRKICYDLPRKRRTAFFSATLLPDTLQLAKSILYRPAKVQLTAEKPDVTLIEQIAYYVDKPNKLNLLFHLLQDKAITSALIFVRSKTEADQLTQHLAAKGYKAQSLHANKLQEDRHEAFRLFQTGECAFLVATDLAARGIDIPTLDCVINYDMPSEPQTYVHRIGRTGRAGREGCAISLVTNAELRFLKPIRQLVGKKSIAIVEQHPFSYAPRVK